jgi:hypothetical protein
MRPDRMPSKWVKLVPWYYTERNAPSRQSSLGEALAAEDSAEYGDSSENFYLGNS